MRNAKTLTFRNGLLNISFLDSSKRHAHLPIFLRHISVLTGDEPKPQKTENARHLWDELTEDLQQLGLVDGVEACLNIHFDEIERWPGRSVSVCISNRGITNSAPDGSRGRLAFRFFNFEWMSLALKIEAPRRSGWFVWNMGNTKSTEILKTKKKNWDRTRS
jgi:hypothetical protein